MDTKRSISFEITTVEKSADLKGDLLETVLDCQRAFVTEGIGQLHLTPEMRFHFARVQVDDGSSIRLETVAVLIEYSEEDGTIWVQGAYVRPEYRRLRIFSKLVRFLEGTHGGFKLGFGVRATNAPMIAALTSLGYVQPVLYFWKGNG